MEYQMLERILQEVLGIKENVQVLEKKLNVLEKKIEKIDILEKKVDKIEEELKELKEVKEITLETRADFEFVKEYIEKQDRENAKKFTKINEKIEENKMEQETDRKRLIDIEDRVYKNAVKIEQLQKVVNR